MAISICRTKACSPYKQKTLLMCILSCLVMMYILQMINVHVPRDQSIQRRLKYTVRDLNDAFINESLIKKKVNTISPLIFEYLHKYKGKVMEYSKRVLDNRTSEWNFHYENFTLREPLFINNRSKDLFYNSNENKEALAPITQKLITGKVYVVKNGTYDAAHSDCGYRATLADVTAPRAITRGHWYQRLVAITSPEAGTFQHFIDGALPKIIQVLHFIKDQRLTVLFRYKPRDKIVLEMLERLNISSNLIIYDANEKIGADLLYFTCITPPLHPTLWQSARRMIGASERLEVPVKEAYVVFVTREGCHNCGRNVINKNDLVSRLSKRYGPYFKQFKGGLNLKATIHLFSKARIVLGSHGGGMYNINFAPINTTVIEFMPTLQDGTMMAASKRIIWNQADLLDQIYWRIATTPINGSKGDMLVDLNELESILNVTDSKQGFFQMFETLRKY